MSEPFFAYLSVALVALLITLVITPLVKRFAVSLNAVDKPGTRKIHTNATPRMGGLGIFVGFSLSVVLFAILKNDIFLSLLYSKDYLYIYLGALVMLGLGIADDKVGLNAKIKFTVQFTVAIFLVCNGLLIERITNPFGAPFELGWIAYPITVIWIVGVTNAINLSDGLDGLASGICLISALTMFAISLITKNAALLVLSAALIGALLGFLRYNFNPAQIFMGDTGSLSLGFLLATLSIKGSLVSSTTVSLLIPVIAMGLPIIDTLFAIVRRLITGKNPFSADKQHVHHRLLSFGLNQRQVVILLYGICILFGCIALALTAAQNEMAASLLLIFGIIVYTGIRRLGYIETIIIRMKHERYRQKKRLYKALYYDDDDEKEEISLWHRLSARQTIIKVGLDFVFIFVSFSLTRFFSEGANVIAVDSRLFRNQFVIIMLCCFASFLLFGYYRALWRYISLDAIGKYVKGVTVGALSSYFALAFFEPSLALPPRHFIIFWLFLLVLVTASRLLFNFYATYQKRELTRLSGGERVLIYGAGDRGEVALNSLIKEDIIDYRPIGFIDDNPAKYRKEILGYSIMGGIKDLEKIVIANQVQRIIISSPFINGNREGVLKEICRKHNVKLCHFKIQFDPISLAN
jgi:UDP-GlcNAc:undecaprenyl-phosphate/decaprenyl-phosphate GlcNAc-1-phosphate transferase